MNFMNVIKGQEINIMASFRTGNFVQNKIQE